MNVTATERTITEYHLTLSAADAQAAVDSPYVFADELADRLRAAGLAPTPPAGSNGHRKPGPRSQLRLGRKANGRGPKAQTAKKGVRPASASLQRVNCPQCGQEIARKYLPLHLTKKHAAAPASAAPSGSTN